MKWIAIALVAYFVYRAWNASQSDEVPNDDTLTMPKVNSNLQTQPQQKYYVKPEVDPRVDGQDQPWYTFDRSFQGMSGLDFLAIGDSDSISTYNTKAFWSELGSRYSH